MAKINNLISYINKLITLKIIIINIYARKQKLTYQKQLSKEQGKHNMINYINGDAVIAYFCD